MIKLLNGQRLIDDLMKQYSSENKKLIIDVCDPAGINALNNNYEYEIINAQKFMEIARSIKSQDEIICYESFN